MEEQKLKTIHMKARDGQRKENFLVSARNELSKYRPIKYMAESAYMRKIEYQKRRRKKQTPHTHTLTESRKQTRLAKSESNLICQRQMHDHANRKRTRSHWLLNHSHTIFFHSVVIFVSFARFYLVLFQFGYGLVL